MSQVSFGSLDPSAPPPGELLDVQELAQLLKCSPRHCYRLADRGALPRPLKLGALIRWSRSAIRKWIDEGCPVQRGGTK